MVALDGTLLVVFQICAAKHGFFLFSRGDTCIFPKRITHVFLDNAFLDECLVFCATLCGLKQTLFIQDLVCVGRACVLLKHQNLKNGEFICSRPWLAGVGSI